MPGRMNRRARRPNRSDKNIFRLMVVTRYETFRDPDAETFMLGWADGGLGLSQHLLKRLDALDATEPFPLFL